MSENSTLCIHTQLPPEGATKVIYGKGDGRRKKRRWGWKKGTSSGAVAPPSPQGEGFRMSGTAKRLPLGGKLSPKVTDEGEKRRTYAVQSDKKLSKEDGISTHTGRNAHRPRAARPRRKLTAGDRLLRNSAVACAVLLGVLALGNIRQPWAEKASQSIEQALTMRINLDDSLGELTFVKGLMPESALVFLNVSGSASMARPVEGAVAHAWSALQPWTLFEGEGDAVRAVGAGTVTAVSPLSGGGYGLLIDHGEGLESVYANLSEVSVASGDAVAKGDVLGVGGDGLYFELRSGGESVDPAERLGL